MSGLIQKTIGIFKRFSDFIGETKSEMKKVSWPDKNEIFNTTIVVILTSFFFGFYLFLVDMVIKFSLDQLFSRLVK